MIIISILWILAVQNIIDKPKIITLDPSKGIESYLLLSDYAKTVKYIKLQTNDNCMVSEVIKLQIDQDNLFIITRYGQYSRLLKFSIDGSFKCEIGSQGRGPGEYSTVLDIALDRNKKKIFILDTMGKVLYFDYLGNYEGNFILTSRPSSMLIWKDKLIFFSAWPDYYLNKGYGIQIKQLGSKNDKYLLNRKWIKGERRQGVMIYPNYSFGINTDNTVSFFESKFDTLYNIDANFNIQAKTIVRLYNKIPYNLLTQNEYNDSYKDHNVLYDIIDANKFMFFTVMTPKPSMTYFYVLDKSTLQVKKHNTTLDKQYFKNDIDEGLTFKPKGVADVDLLYSSIDCYKLKDHLASIKNRESSILKEKKVELINLVNTSSLSDNPIIMLVKLR